LEEKFKDVLAKIVEESKIFVKQEANKMYDLIYTENYSDYKEIKEVIKKEYQKADIEDASDTVHTNRFSVEFEIEQESWFEFIIKNGFAMLSLNFQFMVRNEPYKIKELVDKLNIKEK